MFQPSQFKPTWWLKSPHAQSILPKLLRKGIKLTTITETVELPDGDFVDLAWTEKPTPDTTKPIVVVLHGLEGSVNSPYAKGMLQTIQQQGWTGLLIHFRGCSGRPNRLPNSYHSADIRDLNFFSPWLSTHFPNAPLFLVGFSLGGNVAVNYLAANPDNPYRAAAVICAPLDLASCSKKVNQGSSKIYQKYLLDLLKNSSLKKYQEQQLAELLPEKIKAIKTLWEFDDLVTAPLNGFKDAADYYQQASGKPRLQLIKQPTLLIHAIDDPFLNHQDIIAIDKLPTNLHFEISQHGGHVGFIYGNNPFKPKFWLEERIPQFFLSYL